MLASAQLAPRILASVLALVVSGLAVTACSPPTGTDAGGDVGAIDALDLVTNDATGADVTRCTNDNECSDRVFCNGLERCMPGAAGADSRGCIAAVPASPCSSGETCNEGTQRCTSDCEDRDMDGHGVMPCGDDCDDNDANRFPGNMEVCPTTTVDGGTIARDDHDEDCDPCTVAAPIGRTSDGDLDLDSLWSAACVNPFPAGRVPACVLQTVDVDTTQNVTRGRDCNDADQNIRVNQTEACNGIDDNCNGLTDEGLDLVPFYADGDGDGFGAGPSVGSSCSMPAGRSARNDDCNDSNPDVHPGAVEICDLIDQDCSLFGGAAGGLELSEDADEDGFSSPTTACLGRGEPGAPATAMSKTDCDDRDPDAYPGATESCDGRLNNCTDPNNRDGLARGSIAGCGGGAAGAFLCIAGSCAPARHVVDLARGPEARHSCARLSDGSVFCWGDNSRGQIGDSSTIDRPSPRLVVGLPGAQQIAVGRTFTCALLNDRTVRCWGDNSYGQVGATDRGPAYVSPVAIPGLSGVTQIALGGSHACARLSDATVRCWGRNDENQLGDGTTMYRTTPVAVTGLTGVASITAGLNHVCARMNDGTVRCWGANTSGQIGDGTTTTRLAPVATTGLANVAQISAGGSHTCARLNDGTVRCWGANSAGALGDGTTTRRLTPVTVSGVSGPATDLTAGDFHTCISDDLGVACWGSNSAGQLGDGTPTDRPSLVRVANVDYARDFSAHSDRTCVLESAGAVRCWGNRDFGGIGDGATLFRATPVAATGATDIRALTALADHTCATHADGSVDCWGSTSTGGTILGRTFVPTPTPVAGVTNAVAFGQSYTRMYALLADGTVRSWDGLAQPTGPITSVPGLANVTAIVHARGELCGLLGDGTVTCWTSSTMPTAVAGITNATQIAMGHERCALLADRTVTCWTTSTAPMPVAGLANVTSVAVDGSVTCASIGDGSVRCWGGSYGPSPVLVPRLANVASVAGAPDDPFRCALLRDATVRCWGSNRSAQLGDGTTLDRATPVAVIDVRDVASISLGADHACARILDGTVRCWGSIETGQLGNGESFPQRTATFTHWE